MSEDRGERRSRPRGRKPRRKVCSFCVDKIEFIDYKDSTVSPLCERTRQDHAPPHERQLRQASTAAVRGYQARPCHRLDAILGGITKPLPTKGSPYKRTSPFPFQEHNGHEGLQDTKEEKP